MSATTDPRPVVTTADGGVLVLGGRCDACGLRTVADTDSCPDCWAPLTAASYGPGGRVVASTVLRVGVPGHEPPYALAYVVLDDGPRVLAHTPGDLRLAVGSRVSLTGTDTAGDLTARAMEDS